MVNTDLMLVKKKYTVEKFLQELKKEYIAGNFQFIRRRNQKIDYLRSFGWTPTIFFEYLCDNLSYKDFLNGPVCDYNGTPGDIWEFGKYINEIEFYIKIKSYKGMKCLSFHEATMPCIYHLRGV
ncbi:MULTISPECIES: hypothetical protein [unclassified Enterococcus]|uniref:hypothetical protein n=1 Tax=unclassified Enterococcus TaxID=2608891 RepID=UPI001A91A6BF|nr:MULTISPECIES: hypothetical protein [unclassified Enterococcus]MBO0460182.1 hypothetical protein [Enterococcus sp. DIV1298c]MBO1299671.1 hypothetical protein [Enterococcus sp. DIV1271a]